MARTVCVPLAVAAVAIMACSGVLPCASAHSAPKIKKDAPVGFSVHSLQLYAPLSLGAAAAAAIGYQKHPLAFALTPVLMAAALLDWKAAQYRKLIADNEIDVDAYTNSKPSFMDRAKIVALHGLSTGNHVRSLVPHKLAMQSSPFVPGLFVSKRLQAGMQALKLGTPANKPVVVGTIRMGFGHHRIAYSASSWALGTGMQTVFHDLLAIDSPEATLIHEADNMYSKG